MTLYASISVALVQVASPLSGREIAASAGLEYKQAIDALCRMHDAGTVIRFGRKYSSTWALAGTPAALRADAMGAVEAVWRGHAGAGTPTPPGGEGETTPHPRAYSSVTPSKFFGA